jgi:hypothetical protein
MDLPGGPALVVCLEDLIARSARVLLDLAAGLPVARKHARDYLRLMEYVCASRMETVWRDHRKPAHPAAFQEAKAALRDWLPTSADLLIVPRYSQDPDAKCPLCDPDNVFALADPGAVLSLLGYC